MIKLSPRAAALAAVALFVSSLPSQSLSLVRNWKRTNSAVYSDVWGYTAPDGREFAIVGETRGIWIVETTNPANVRQTAFFSAPNSIWRDFTTYKQYIYSVSEGHRGIRIIDMSNPSAPKDLGTVSTSTSAAHNISVDPDTGLLYLSDSRVSIFDAKANPTNPTLLSTWRTSTHDICVRRGYGYMSTGYSGRFQILDVSNPRSLVAKGSGTTPGRYCHNAWVSEDDQLLIVTDEIANSGQLPHVSIWNISNKNAPVKTAEYVGGKIAHNAFIIGRTAYLSYYTDGVRMVDLADPTKPVEVGNYATSTLTSGYNGCWGMYPFTDSGLIYATDIQRGLYVLRVDCGRINRYGAPKVGSNGLVPRLRFDGATPKVGAKKLRMEIENLLPNARFALLISLKSGSSTLHGVQLHVDMPTATILYFTADKNGKATIPAPVPNNPNFANVRAYLQIAGFDKGLPNGFSASRGMWMGVCK